MGEMPATTPADLEVPSVELEVDVEDRDQAGEQAPVVDIPDAALDVDLDDDCGSDAD